MDTTENESGTTTECTFDRKPLHNLTIHSEYKAGVESIFETSTSDLDMPVCNATLRRTASGILRF